MCAPQPSWRVKERLYIYFKISNQWRGRTVKNLFVLIINIWLPISTPLFNKCTKIRKTKMMSHCINTAFVRPCNIIVTKCTQGNNFICIIYNHIFWHQGYWWRCQMTEYKFLQWRLLVTQCLSSGDSFLLRVTIADHNRRVEQSIYTWILSLKCVLLDSILNIQTDNKAEISSILPTSLTQHL
jgi:hypothetical protein